MRLASVMKDVLIAYRGEVAVRVIWACRELGLSAVAVYSEADRTAPHVFLADESYLIGSASSADSCVQIDRILAVAVKSVKDVIHPGYGFLPSVWLLQRPWRRRIFPRTQLLRSFLSLSAERLSPRLGSRGLRIQMVSPPVGLLYPRSGTARDS